MKVSGLARVGGMAWVGGMARVDGMARVEACWRSLGTLGRLGEALEGLGRLWEAQSIVFYDVRRLQELQILTAFTRP